MELAFLLNLWKILLFEAEWPFFCSIFENRLSD